MNIKTNWYIITGGPSSGKTKVIESLVSLGHATVPEIARTLIDAEIKKGKTINEIRLSEADFQKRVFQMKIEVENKLPPKQVVFFDRGIPDSIIYYQTCRLDIKSIVEESQKRKYRGVFLLEQLPFKKDYARIEDKNTASKLGKLLFKAYQDLGYEVVRVPVMPVEERVQFILSRCAF